jgi:hypothetical protein
MFIEELRKNINFDSKRFFILFGVFILVFFVYWEVQNFKEQKIFREELKVQNEKAITLSEEITRLKIQVGTLIGEAQKKTQDEINAKIATLEKDLSEERGRRENLESKLAGESKLSLARIQNLEETASTKDTLSKIISEWRVRTAHVRCNLTFGTSIGSGVLTKFNESGKDVYGVLTNRHVLVDSFGRSATSCTVTFPDSDTQIVGTSQKAEIEVSTKGFDFGRIVIVNPDTKIQRNAANETHFCKETPLFGDELVILGYPYIGAGKDITATDGIVSGFEENFYVTSAKVEQGNSGGTAVLVKKNCLLGIPTYVQAGSLEALARILKIDVLFK